MSIVLATNCLQIEMAVPDVRAACTRFEETLGAVPIEEELVLIRELEYEKYFLTCYDIVTFARERGILCQGRGAAFCGDRQPVS